MNEVMEVIGSFNGYIMNVAKGSIQIGEHLRNNNLSEALQMILQFSEGMNWLVEASHLLKQNNVIVEFNVEKIHQFLIEINNGLEVQDYVLVADMFEYEIAPFFEEVKTVNMNI